MYKIFAMLATTLMLAGCSTSNFIEEISLNFFLSIISLMLAMIVYALTEIHRLLYEILDKLKKMD
ncbi:MAG: hypothetical protein ACK4VI_00485 [Alphaproteobacteria bacterium]